MHSWNGVTLLRVENDEYIQNNFVKKQRMPQTQRGKPDPKSISPRERIPSRQDESELSLWQPSRGLRPRRRRGILEYFTADPSGMRRAEFIRSKKPRLRPCAPQPGAQIKLTLARLRVPNFFRIHKEICALACHKSDKCPLFVSVFGCRPPPPPRLRRLLPPPPLFRPCMLLAVNCFFRPRLRFVCGGLFLYFILTIPEDSRQDFFRHRVVC